MKSKVLSAVDRFLYDWAQKEKYTQPLADIRTHDMIAWRYQLPDHPAEPAEKKEGSDVNQNWTENWNGAGAVDTGWRSRSIRRFF